MHDMVTRAKLQDEAVMREVRKWYEQGNLAEVQAIIDANPDLAERIEAYMALRDFQDWERLANGEEIFHARN